jgi:hypothetical protein
MTTMLKPRPQEGAGVRYRLKGRLTPADVGQRSAAVVGTRADQKTLAPSRPTGAITGGTLSFVFAASPSAAAIWPARCA